MGRWCVPQASNAARKRNHKQSFAEESRGGHMRTRHENDEVTTLRLALEVKSDGIVFLGNSGEIVFANDAALMIVRGRDGLEFSHMHLATGRPPETRKLNKLIADAVVASLGTDDPSDSPMLVTRPSGMRPYLLHIVSAPRSERLLIARSIFCVIHIRDLGVEQSLSRETLGIFGFTGREVDLAAGLVRFADLKKAAAAAHMAHNTARNHLQQIFRKTGTATQTALVQLLSRAA
jgi:DNA-binding CsgD family transcriptional regulator